MPGTNRGIVDTAPRGHENFAMGLKQVGVTAGSGAATAGGQTAINVGGLLAPPLFGVRVETAGYAEEWAFLAGCAAAATGLLFAVRRRTRGCGAQARV